MSVLLKLIANENPDEMREASHVTIELKICKNLITMKNCNKPIVALVRGTCVGIGFTTMSHFDFVYCDPKATLMTPFMQSA